MSYDDCPDDFTIAICCNYNYIIINASDTDEN